MISYLKWVGGKSRLFKDLYIHFPQKINKYIEPFVGSASVVLNMMEEINKTKYLLNNNFYFDDVEIAIPKKFIVNDYNYYLIQCHLSVKENIEDLIINLKRIQNDYNSCSNKLFFYKKKRDELNKFISKKKIAGRDKTAFSSIFIFINKTCFNGIWRVNKNNKYNVPWNQNIKVNIYSEKNILLVSNLFQEIEFNNEDFDKFVRKNVRKNDFVFLDPPYIPISDTSNFTGYTNIGWNKSDNIRLSKLLDFIDEKKAKFMMTNSFSSVVLDLFGKWEIKYMEAHRFVKPEKRGDKDDSKTARKKVKETIITNY